jgi:hypothetical protein
LPWFVALVKFYGTSLFVYFLALRIGWVVMIFR